MGISCLYLLGSRLAPQRCWMDFLKYELGWFPMPSESDLGCVDLNN